MKVTHVAEIVKLTHVARILEAGSMYDQQNHIVQARADTVADAWWCYCSIVAWLVC